MTSGLYSLNVDGFPGYVEDMHANDNAGFLVQFKVHYTQLPATSCVIHVPLASAYS